MNSRKPLAVAAVACAVVFGTVGVAYAASIGTATSQVLGVARASVPKCSASAATFGNLKTLYLTTTNRYEVHTFTLSVPSGCTNKVCKLVVADQATGASLATEANLTTGSCTTPTVAGTPTTYTFNTGSGPSVTALAGTTAQVRFVLQVTS